MKPKKTRSNVRPGSQSKFPKTPGKAPTSDNLRDHIDHGAAGDKKSFSDPAAAPHGTDAEAGGAPPTAGERSNSFADESRAPSKAQRRERADATPAMKPFSLILVALVAALVIGYLAMTII